jgi:hypothetical protein
MSTRVAREDEPDAYREENGTWRVIDGALALHVDDFLGGGESVNSVYDIEQTTLQTYKERWSRPRHVPGKSTIAHRKVEIRTLEICEC